MASSDTDIISHPPHVPGYELIRRVGRGSYGEVWLARSPAGLYRAVKIVRRDTFEKDRPYEREYSGIQKFEPVSRLHASQVAVLEVGRNDEAGFFYYAMELADPAVDAEHLPVSVRQSRAGSSVPPAWESYRPRNLRSEIVRQGRIPFEECLRTGIALATALDHLHRHGLVHRDIKPSNVIFVDGVPKLADIGLVTDVGATLTYVGTEGFLPPEGPGTPVADIYGLGKVIYEMATGRDRLDFPTLPDGVDGAFDQERMMELNLVLLKACQNDPVRRYQSVRELLADLAILNGGGSLRRQRALEFRMRSIRRALVGVVSTALGAAVVWGYADVVRARRAAERLAQTRHERDLQVQATLETRGRLASLYRQRAREAAASDDIGGAALWEAHSTALQSHVLDSGASPLRSWVRFAGTITAANPLHRIAVLASEPDRTVSLSEQALSVWDWNKPGIALRTVALERRLLSFQMLPERALICLKAAGGLSRWENWGDASVDLEGSEGVESFSMEPAGRWVAACATNGVARVWESSTGKGVMRAPGVGRDALVVLSPDGRRLAVGQTSGSIRIWDTASGQAQERTLAQGQSVRQILFSPDGSRLFTVGGGTVLSWDSGLGEPGFARFVHDAEVSVAALGPTGAWIVTGTVEGGVHLWDTVQGRSLGRSPSLTSARAVERLEVSADGCWIAAWGAGELRLLRRCSATGLQRVFRIPDGVTHCAFAPEGRWLLVAERSGSLSRWELESEPLVVFSTEEGTSAEQMVSLAELWAGRRMQDEQAVVLDPGQRLVRWQTQRALLGQGKPGLTAGEWHSRRASADEKGGDWVAAAFHWNRASIESDRSGEGRAFKARAVHAASNSIALEPRQPLPVRIPPRPAGLTARQLDLSAFYDAPLGVSWLGMSPGATSNDLGELARVPARFGGLDFDLRGVIQLSSVALENRGKRFRRQVTGIPVGQRAVRIHFVHATVWDAVHRTQVGTYRIHYTDGETRDIPLLFGETIGDWWCSASALRRFPATAVVWQGSNDASREAGMSVRIFQMSWINPRQAQDISSLELISAMDRPAPFLLGITLEPERLQ